MQPAGLDVIVRLDDPSDMPRLDHCLFSLFGQSSKCQSLKCQSLACQSPACQSPACQSPACQSACQSLACQSPACQSPDADPCGPLRLHLMLWRFSFAEVQAVRTATQALRALDEATQLTMHNWQIPEPSNLSVPLLNWGLEVARGRYFSCLDVSDLVLPGAYGKLMRQLRLTRAAVAIGGAVTQPVRWWGDVLMPLTPAALSTAPDQPDSGAADPPSLFVLDRARVPAQELKFRVGPPDHEVVEFVRRIGKRHPVDTSLHDDLLVVRQVPE